MPAKSAGKPKLRKPLPSLEELLRLPDVGTLPERVGMHARYVRGRQAKNRRPSWKDWEPEGINSPVLPVPLLLKLANSAGLPVSESRFQAWRSQGILPGPVRDTIDGVITKPYYPAWYLNCFARILELQEEGHTLARIALILRPWAEATQPWLRYQKGRQYPKQVEGKFAVLAAVSLFGAHYDEPFTVEIRDADGNVIATHTTED